MGGSCGRDFSKLAFSPLRAERRAWGQPGETLGRGDNRQISLMERSWHQYRDGEIRCFPGGLLWHQLELHRPSGIAWASLWAGVGITFPSRAPAFSLLQHIHTFMSPSPRSPAEDQCIYLGTSVCLHQVTRRLFTPNTVQTRVHISSPDLLPPVLLLTFCLV